MSSSTDTDPVRLSVEFGATHWSAAVGPYTWHEFDAERVAAELRDMRPYGVRAVRTLLPWDAFMPALSGVPAARLRDFETFLALAAQSSLSVVPVLFAQSLGDCIMLPAYAIDVRDRRPGVRVLTDAVVQPGGPRDQYTDSLMLDAAITWLDTMLGAFSGHPAIAAWDLGHDPATTMRPRRIEHMRTWTQLFAGRVRERHERAMLTLGTRDLVTARAVRPEAVAAELDGLAILIEPEQLDATDPADARTALFIVQLAMRLTVNTLPLQAHVHSASALAALVESGVAGVFASAWSNASARAMAVAPLDSSPELGSRGLVDVKGEPTDFGIAWREYTSRERERQAQMPLRAHIDVDDYYANLPESMQQLRAQWEDGLGDIPGMLA